MHNGHCAKWECDTRTTTTAGRCENKSTNIGKCVPAGGSLYHNPHSHISNNGGIAPYINQACARSNHPEACHTAIQPFVSVCLPKGGNIHTPIGNYPLLNENYIWITRTAAERIFALPDYRPTEDPCPISESEIWNGQKPSCSRGTEWRCPEMADSRAEYRNQPVCERQEAINCASLSENSCKSQSSTCTRKPGSSSTTTGYKCIRQDGQPATAADCDPTWAKPSCESEGTKNNPKLIRYSDENIGLQNQYILWSLGSVPFTSFDSVIIDARDANPEQEANAEAENKVRNTNTFRELPGTTNGTRTITISFLTHNKKRDMIVKVGSQSGGKQPYYFKLQYDPHYSDLQYYGVSNNMHQEKPYTYMFYQAYQEQTQQCNGSISLTRGYEPSQFLDPSKFFCIHHPVGKPILKKVYIKGSGNTWSNYKFYKDDKYKYPIENGLYHTNHDYVGSMNASYRFHRLKIYAMVILNGGIRDDIVLQKRNN